MRTDHSTDNSSHRSRVNKGRWDDRSRRQHIHHRTRPARNASRQLPEGKERISLTRKSDNQHNVDAPQYLPPRRKPQESMMRQQEDRILKDFLPSSSFDVMSDQLSAPKNPTRDQHSPTIYRKKRQTTKQAFESPGRKRTRRAETLGLSSKDRSRSLFRPTSPGGLTGSLNVVKVPIKMLAVLMEVHLLWWFIQLCILVYMTSCVDYKLRLRAPIKEFPSYSALRMPWVPGQIGMRDRLLAVWITLALVYLPAVLIHLVYFIDHVPPKVLLIRPRKELQKPWYLKERYTHLFEPKRRQLLNFSLLVIGSCLWIYYFLVFLSDTFFPIQESYWYRTLDKWLYDLQRYYFLQFEQLPYFIEPEDRIPSYHRPDDGSKPLLIIDLIQSIFECCGRTTGYRDWNSPHVYRPKNQTYRKAMRIGILNEKVHYLIPTLNNESVPFSCCRWRYYEATMAPLACDHMAMQNKSTIFDRGCVEPLSHFLQYQWMLTQLVPLLVVLITMVPQLFLLLVALQPKQLKRQAIEFGQSVKNFFENKYKKAVTVGRDIATVLSRTGSQLRRSTTIILMDLEEFEDQDYYKVVRAQVAASEREIYEENKQANKQNKVSHPHRDATKSNIKPSPHLENRKDPGTEKIIAPKQKFTGKTNAET